MVTAKPALGEPGATRVSERLDAAQVWTDHDLTEAGISVREVPLATVGGGLGSFALVDLLRICGARTSDITVLSCDKEPQNSFERLCVASQLGSDGPLRSDSSSRIDNLWGFPGYAASVAWKSKRVGPLVRVATEPVLSEYFNPTGGQVFEGVRREAARIGWESMLAPGKVVAIRRRAGGGFFVAQHVSPVSRSTQPPVVWRTKYVHIAPGYPAVNLSPDLLTYRTLNPGEKRTAHSYEPHEHIYESLGQQGGSVLLRGSGNTTAHVLHRLCAARRKTGSNIKILHLIRDYIDGPAAFPTVGHARRPGRDGYSIQQFVFPRAAGGGVIARAVARMEPEAVTPLLGELGAPSKPSKQPWERELAAGRREGWYRVHHGQVETLTAAPNSQIDVSWRGPGEDATHELVDFLIDATGVLCGIEVDPLLADMVDSGIGSANRLGRLAVGSSFELDTGEAGAWRAYASGAITFGGPVIPVAVFWGLHYAALRIADDLANRGFCPRLTPWRSTLGWTKWVAKVRLP